MILPTQDILIAVTDGLKGMEQALNAVFPATTLRTCIVHLIRASLDYASWKERRTVAPPLKPTKLLWLVLRTTEAGGGATHDWKTAMNQFAIIYAERFTDPYR